MAQIDVRDTDREQRRDRVFDALDALDDGATAVITADRDPHPVLCQYAITRGAALDREYEQTGDDWRVRVTNAGDRDGSEPFAFDVRNMPPSRRHAVLTDTFDLLEPGESFVLVNDHDPEPLYHELRSTHGDVVGWSYGARDAGEWRVEIAKTGESAAVDDGAAATFDVREIPKPKRHETVHHRYANLRDGEALDVIAPHEPTPLHEEFRQQYGDDFEWDVLERDPSAVRVRITKQVGTGGENGGESGDSSDTGESGDSSDTGEDVTVVEELDVRDRPPAQRHEAIFDAYDALDAGEGFVLVNDHDPKPLYHQFEAEAGPEFHWAYRARDPGEFRVLVAKTETASTDGVGAEDVDAPF
ncbi:MAG: DUF2249 domain-containing protein [Halobacterium sp.]